MKSVGRPKYLGFLPPIVMEPIFYREWKTLVVNMKIWPSELDKIYWNPFLMLQHSRNALNFVSKKAVQPMHWIWEQSHYILVPLLAIFMEQNIRFGWFEPIFLCFHGQFLKILYLQPRIYKEGWTERAIILRKLNKSLLESSKSVGIHRQKSLNSLKNLE